jgi:hypothetical protein
MMVSLSYDFSTFLMENSCAKISGHDSMFNSVREPYVFTIVFLSYPMYSHDFSCFSPGIIFCIRPANSFLDGEELDPGYFLSLSHLGSEHFSKSVLW